MTQNHYDRPNFEPSYTPLFRPPTQAEFIAASLIEADRERLRTIRPAPTLRKFSWE